ncbi:MAG: hypothetical protein M3P93_06050 [Actinomycetota bacterium]|nr:hypothetical protein [Actinomycetota bacterium]
MEQRDRSPRRRIVNARPVLLGALDLLLVCGFAFDPRASEKPNVRAGCQ